jgi:hypothetical protein
MNLKHFHRSNTEEYQRELQGLNNSAQLPLLPRSQMTYPPEAKGRATHYPITHAQSLMKSEPLLKANFKQLKQMFPNTNEHDHVLKWASDIKNNDLQSFYLRHYRNNPSIHTDAMKEKIGHINGMIDISDEMKKVKLSKEDTLESGLQKYEDAEKKWQTGNGSRFVTPSATTKPVIDFGDGWGWFDLGVPTDRDEGNALGHCGNAGNPHSDDRILSLRKVHNIGGKIYHEPALTFINNQGWIGEMKGRNNSKPSEKYHSRIAELLKHKDIKGLVGAGYMPENNFHFDDLSPEHKNQVKMTNPEFVDLRSNEWDIDHKTKTAVSAPKIEKYKNTISDIFKAHKLKTDLDSGKITMDDIEPEDLRLVTNHPHFERKDFDRLIQNTPRFFSNLHERANAYGAIKNSRYLTSDDLHKILDNDIDGIVFFKDHKLIDSSHIDKVVIKNPRLAARVLNDHRLLNLEHIDRIIERNPALAAERLKDHPEFNSSHIDKIIERNPLAAAEYFHDHPKFNSSHIDRIIEKDPALAAERFKDHPEFNSSHIDKIIEKDPRAAAEYFHDHPLLNEQHIDKIIEKDPKKAAEHLNNHPLLNSDHIDKMIEKAPWLVAEYLNKHPLLNSDHIDKIIEKEPWSVAEHLNNHPLLNSGHIDKIIDSPMNSAQILKDNRLLNSSHIDKIIEKDPESAAQHLWFHPLLNEQHIDKIVKNAPWAAAEYLDNHPIYKAKYGQQQLQKSFKALTNEYEKLLKVIFVNGTWYPEPTDEDGTPHPELRDYVVHTARNLKKVWSYHPKRAAVQDDILRTLAAGGQNVFRNGFPVFNKIKYLNSSTQSAIRSFTNSLLGNQDRHVLSANTDPNKPESHMEMRARHLISALTGNEGYEIKDHPDGFEVYAPRHSKSVKATVAATRWIYNKNTKNLSSENISFDPAIPTPANKPKNNLLLPVSAKKFKKSLKFFKSMPKRTTIGGDYGKQNEQRGNDGDGFGSLSRRDDGGRYSFERISSDRKTELFKSSMGKTKIVLSKSFRQLKKEYETLKKEIKTVYHGSKTPVDGFSQDKANEQVGRWGHGVYFADHKPEAKTYGQHVYQTQIDTDKHLDLHDNFDLNKFNEYAKNHPDQNSVKEINDIAKLYPDTNYIDVFSQFGHSPKRAKILSDFIEHLGYDGVRYEFANPTKLGYAMMLPLSFLLPNIDMARIPKKRKGTKNTQSYYTKFNTNFPVEPSNDDEVSLKKAKPLKRAEELKRSKNAKQQIKNISEEERKKRLLAYAQNLGLTPVHDERDEEQELPNSYSGSQFYFNPNDELFSPEHEIGHAMLSPEGESVGEYMKRISSSPTQKEDRDEIINHALDAKIARRAGVAPRSVVPPPDLYEDAGEPIPKPLTFKTAFSPYQNEVKEIIGQFDEGKKFDSKGIKTIKDSIDRKINIRAKEAAKDVSRKDAKTLMRSQALKKAEDEAGMTAYPLKDGYSIHHETSQNGYDIWAIGHGGQRAGTFMICTDETRRGRPFVSWAGVENPHRGKGIGVVAYKALAAHYGGLDSDRNSTSVDALKAWRRAGGKQLKTKTHFGDPRYTLEGDKKRPPIVWNKDLEKAQELNKKSPKPLKGLHAEAAKYNNFNDFKKAFLIEIKHGTYWHVTDNPNFQIDPKTGPRDMTSLGMGKKYTGALMITSHLEHWVDFYGKKNRPYAALIDMSDAHPDDYKQVNRGFGNEFYVKNSQKAKTIKVMPVDEAIKYDQKQRKKMPQNEEELRNIYESVHKQNSSKSQNLEKTTHPNELLEKDIPQAKFTKLLPANQRPEQDVKRIEQGKFDGGFNYTPSEKVAEKQLRTAYGYRGAGEIIEDIRQNPTHSGYHDPYSTFPNSKIKRGITVASTKALPSVVAHEAHHRTVTKLINKYGEDKVHNLYSKMVDKVPQNLKILVTNLLRTYPSYAQLHESSAPRHQLAFKEELVNYIRDLATDGGTEGRRHQVKEIYKKNNNYIPKAVGMETFEKVDALLKKTWKDIHTFANHATEEHLG